MQSSREGAMPEAAEAGLARESPWALTIYTVASLVFLCLPLHIQAIALPALSKAWKQWAQEGRAKERALEQAERLEYYSQENRIDIAIFDVPLWAVQQQRQQPLSDEQKRRFQLRAVAHGDVGAADSAGGTGSGEDQLHNRVLCASAARCAASSRLTPLTSMG